MRKIKQKIRELLRRFARYILRDELPYLQELRDCSKNKMIISLDTFIAILKILPDANEFAKGHVTAEMLRGGKPFESFGNHKFNNLRFKRVSKNSIIVEVIDERFDVKIPLMHTTIRANNGYAEVTTFTWDVAHCNVSSCYDWRTETAIKEFLTAVRKNA